MPKVTPRHFIIPGLMTAVVLASACGQRGPLYLPDKQVVSDENSTREGKLIRKTEKDKEKAR